MRKVARWVMTALLTVVLGAGIRWLYEDWQTLRQPVAARHTEQLWAAEFKDASGKPYALQQYRGKPMIVNFWATWCEPCREEMPEISALAEAHPEVVVLGLAIDDAASVHEFVQAMPIAYPLLIAEEDGMLLAEALGNHKGVLPYTVILSASGEVRQTFLGRVNRQMLQKALNLP